MSIGPCTYPGCRQAGTGPALTAYGVCEYCRGRFQRLLRDVILDYVTLKAFMPKPATVKQVVQQKSAVKSFGHPAEWASTTAQEIALLLREHHAALAEDLGHREPLPEHADESTIAAQAYRYLHLHFESLATFHGTQAVAEELTHIHQTVRRSLGHTRPRERLHAPCPNCNLAALIRYPGTAGPTIQCEACGYESREEHYDLYVATVAAECADNLAANIDQAIRDYDQQEAS